MNPRATTGLPNEYVRIPLSDTSNTGLREARRQDTRDLISRIISLRNDCAGRSGVGQDLPNSRFWILVRGILTVNAELGSIVSYKLAFLVQTRPLFGEGHDICLPDIQG